MVGIDSQPASVYPSLMTAASCAYTRAARIGGSRVRPRLYWCHSQAVRWLRCGAVRQRGSRTAQPSAQRSDEAEKIGTPFALAAA